MKPRIVSTARLSFALAALIAGSSTHAATYYWDNNGTAAGFGSAAGNWAAPTTGNSSQGWTTATNTTTTPGNITSILGMPNSAPHLSMIDSTSPSAILGSPELDRRGVNLAKFKLTV